MSRSFGIWLRARRQRLRLTQRQLAELLGVTQPSVGRWEQGQEVMLGRAQDLARVLGVSVSELVAAAAATPAERESSVAAGGWAASSRDREVLVRARPQRAMDEAVRPIDSTGEESDSVPMLVYELRGAGDVRRLRAAPDADPMAIDVLFCPRYRLRHPASKVVALKIASEALAPELAEGVTVVVELTDDWRPGDRVLALVDDVPYLRRLARNGHGLLLVSDRGQAAIPVDERVEIVGRAIGMVQWW